MGLFALLLLCQVAIGGFQTDQEVGLPARCPHMQQEGHGALGQYPPQLDPRTSFMQGLWAPLGKVAAEDMRIQWDVDPAYLPLKGHLAPTGLG